MLNSYEIINFKHHKIYKIKIDGIDTSKLLEDIDIDRKFLVIAMLFYLTNSGILLGQK